jgi:trehalose-6-phosphatase
VLVGKKAIEVRPKGINKATAVKKIFAIHEEIPFDFVFCIGDDKTDEGTPPPTTINLLSYIIIDRIELVLI